ncbi:Spy/CpxP family protein refolding chaperone [Thauera sp. 2A1]|uniref:Spy/CpxP family protein refolding chaperone n=1 Tax=Thauera sp. 2A1 TaxID=2570191 RepID=UPI001D179D29|nr:Spy/CpxP family protein refolding chaperone [Thauera sp. 2A1]KAI5915634.1 Spy/CpxP family protein refolding chaperone [Thauera sp. 2A1]
MTEKRRVRFASLASWIGAAAMAVVAGTAVAAAPQAAQGQAAWGCPPGGGPGYGMGPGMMWGPGAGGPGRMGPGMGIGPMGGYWGRGLDLSDEQRSKVNAIQDEVRKQHWGLMGSMMDEQSRLRDLYEAAKPDSAAIEQAYKRIGELQQKMFESSIDAHKRMDAVLTDEQRKQMHSLWRRGW